MSRGLWKTQAHKVSRATHDCIGGDTVQEEKHVEVAENKDTPPRQAPEASIDKQTFDMKPMPRKKKSPLKIKKRVPIGRPWE